MVTQGESLTDAKHMAADGLKLILSSYIEKGMELPKSKTKKAARLASGGTVRAGAMKLALYLEFHEVRMSKTELARKMGIVKQQVDRLSDLQHFSRVEQIELAFSAFGKSLTISVQDAA